MKKFILVMTMVFLAAGVSLVSAEEKADGAKDHHKWGKMGMEHGMMMKMMEKTVVATSDGGIVIVAGNKISKYDKNLNLVKEIELKMDMECLQKSMHEMKAMCPMMGKKSDGDKDMDMDDDGDEDDAPAAAPAAEEAAPQK